MEPLTAARLLLLLPATATWLLRRRIGKSQKDGRWHAGVERKAIAAVEEETQWKCRLEVSAPTGGRLLALSLAIDSSFERRQQLSNHPTFLSSPFFFLIFLIFWRLGFPCVYVCFGGLHRKGPWHLYEITGVLGVENLYIYLKKKTNKCQIGRERERHLERWRSSKWLVPRHSIPSSVFLPAARRRRNLSAHNVWRRWSTCVATRASPHTHRKTMYCRHFVQYTAPQRQLPKAYPTIAELSV